MTFGLVSGMWRRVARASGLRCPGSAESTTVTVTGIDVNIDSEGSLSSALGRLSAYKDAVSEKTSNKLYIR